MNDWQRQELQDKLRYDTPLWARHCATILNEHRQKVRLEARPWQLSFDAALEKQRADGRPMRAIILKARKLGFSTWVQAKFLQRVSQLPHQHALVVAHNRQAANVLGDMARLMYDHLPTLHESGLGFSIRPQVTGEGLSRGSGKWFALGDKLRPTSASVYETMTAGAKGGGRASTPSMIHASELAHYDDPDYLIGLLNALPKAPETIAVLESTANGFNHFHDRWAKAVEGAEDPDVGGTYIPLFYGWQDNPFNSVPFISDLARDRFERTIGDPDGGGDDEEPWLVESFGVTLEQLYWRRITRDEECNGKVEFFHQEHPATPEQAFIGSGNPVFSSILIAKAIKHAEAAEKPVEGVLRGVEHRQYKTRLGTINIPQAALWVPRPEPKDIDLWGMTHQLKVWEHPVNAHSQEGLPADERVPDRQYVVFVDVAQGIGASTEERDYSAIQVIDHHTRLQVASYRSRIALHDLPLVALLVAAYYNEAELAVEVTGLGIGVVDTLKKDYRYRRLYRRHRAGDDVRQDPSPNMVGWSTDLRTKPLMEQSFGQALKDGTHGLRDILTAREFTTYVEDERGKHGAQKGSHDDLVMAYMGAVHIAKELRPRNKERPKRRRYVSDDLIGY